jgi:hypothetical protein
MGEILYAGAIHIQKQSQIDAARITQKSGNERRAAESELGRFSASLSNRRVMDAAGKNINAITENIGRNLNAGAFGTFMGRVQAAEELGANTAALAAQGVGGSSMEVYNATVRMSNAMQEEQRARAINSDNIAASAQRGDVLVDATGSLDNNVIRADLDFNQYVDHKKMGLLTRVMAVGAAATATYFGGPQAGSAVLGAFEGHQKARNGDIAGASQSMMGAIQNGIGGFKTYRAGASAGPKNAPKGDSWDSVKPSGYGSHGGGGATFKFAMPPSPFNMND